MPDIKNIHISFLADKSKNCPQGEKKGAKIKKNNNKS